MSVCRAPAWPPEHAHELALTVDATHRPPIASGFLGDEHGLINCAKRHGLYQLWPTRTSDLHPRAATRECLVEGNLIKSRAALPHHAFLWLFFSLVLPVAR